MGQGEGEGHGSGIVTILVRRNIMETSAGQACFGQMAIDGLQTETPV